jgi:hypothetical protein
MSMGPDCPTGRIRCLRDGSVGNFALNEAIIRKPWADFDETYRLLGVIKWLVLEDSNWMRTATQWHSCEWLAWVMIHRAQND